VGGPAVDAAGDVRSGRWGPGDALYRSVLYQDIANPVQYDFIAAFALQGGAETVVAL
jgi:hypothetical protein